MGKEKYKIKSYLGELISTLGILKMLTIRKHKSVTMNAV